jgi:hypothetical protein
MPKARHLGYAFLLLVAVAVAAMVIWNLTGANPYYEIPALALFDQPKKPPEQEQTTKTAELMQTSIDSQHLEKIQAAVHQMHKKLNSLTGWGSINFFVDQSNPKWKEVEQLSESYGTQIEQLLPLIADQDLKRDLITFKGLLEIAAEEKLEVALRYAHRVIHDLDYWVFNSATEPLGERDYWAATITLEKESTRYHQWLEDRQRASQRIGQ